MLDNTLRQQNRPQKAPYLSRRGIGIAPILGVQGISRDDARAVEPVLIEYNGLGQNRALYREDAATLRFVGYPGFK